MLAISWIILLAAGVACLYLPFVQWYYWRGFWRWLAIVPALLPLSYFAWSVVGMLSDPPDHSIHGPLFFGLIAISLLLSVVLRAWHQQKAGQ